MIDDARTPLIISRKGNAPTDKYIKLHKVIHYWNNEQKKFAKKNNIPLFNIDALVTEIIHFSNDIEPSEIGSKLIADAITNII